MKIEQIRLENFRIYQGEVDISFDSTSSKNISLIAGKNGFGKTSFLTSLIWAFYGRMMAQVEEKYKKDIKSCGGYDNFLLSLVNNDVRNECDAKKRSDARVAVEVHLVDVLVPSIPCRRVVIRREYSLLSKSESLKILIDGDENELTKEVGYEVFINDFILPREIAKFFFFDAEKIVSLAEAKTKNELRSLSRAYSEVLGIKKYEDLKESLTSLLSRLKRRGATTLDKQRIDDLTKEEKELSRLLELCYEKQATVQDDINRLQERADHLQELLIREGNDITLDELLDLKEQKTALQQEHTAAKNELKKLIELVPLAMGTSLLESLAKQVESELTRKSGKLNREALLKELERFAGEFKTRLAQTGMDETARSSSINVLESLLKEQENTQQSREDGDILLELTQEEYREVLTTVNYVKDSFQSQFQVITKNEKNVRHKLTQVLKQIRQAEARKDNPLAIKLREEKVECTEKINALSTNKNQLSAEAGGLETRLATTRKILSELEKNAELISTDKKKYDATLVLLEKLNVLTAKIKEEKKFSLQKSVQLGLKRLMHKTDFVSDIRVNINGDIMDIDLLDNNGRVIDKDNLSKGEQQLYATALLKALVDESGINFPVFIDSPLQKFDKEHSTNVIQQFYPNVSDQVVLFPLLEKELSIAEYEQLKPNLNSVFLIENENQRSRLSQCELNNLFEKFNEQNYVHAN